MTLADLLFQPGFVSRLILRFTNALEQMVTAPTGSQESQVQFFDFGEMDGPQKVILQIVPAGIADSLQQQIAKAHDCCKSTELRPVPEVTEEDIPELDQASEVFAHKVRGRSGCYTIQHDDYLLVASADPRVMARLQRAVQNRDQS